MNVVYRYLTRDYLVTFGFTLLIFTFVMCVGTVIKAVDLISRGVSGFVILKFFAVSIPSILSYTVPMSTLTTVLLIFSRMSMDGEITALKSCGMNMWQIIAAPVMLSIIMSSFCLYLNSYAAPNSHYAQRQQLREVGVEGPINLLEEGRFVRDFPNIMIYVGKKEGNNVKDVVVYELDERGVKRSVRAKTGTINPDKEKNVLLVDLFDVRIDQPDRDRPMDLSKSKHVSAKKYPVRLDFSKIWDTGKLSKKVADMTLNDLVQAIQDAHLYFGDMSDQDIMLRKMKMLVDANQRLARSVSCFAFTLIGIPLGMRSRRRDSSVGVIISLLLVFVFYLFIITADALVESPEWRPDLITWIPVIAAEIAGFILIRKSN